MITQGAKHHRGTHQASCTVEKEKKIFLISKGIQKGSVAKSYITNGLSYMVKYLRISSYIRKPFFMYGFATDPI
jgi:hypothetical protein